MKTYRWIVVNVLVLMLALPATVVSALPPVISFTAPTLDAAANEVSFDLIISATNVNPGIAGVDIYVKYDPALVSPPKSPNSVAEAKPDFFGVSNINANLPAACPGNTDSCIHLIVAGPPQVTHSGAVARFHFAVNPGASGSACFSVVQATLADADGFPVAPTTPLPTGQCVTVASTGKVDGTVLRQGTLAAPHPAGTLACSTVSVTGATVKTSANGSFSLASLPVGAYTLKASYSGYLDSTQSITIAAGTLTVAAGTTTLRGGDVDGNQVINILDIGSIISKFDKTGFSVGSVPGTCGADEPVDINDDGVVNISDLAIAAGNWGATGPTAWK